MLCSDGVGIRQAPIARVANRLWSVRRALAAAVFRIDPCQRAR